MKKYLTRPLKLDATVLDIGGRYLETTVTQSEILDSGTSAELRSELELIALSLEKCNLPDHQKHWISNCLKKISKGADANTALGLKRRNKHSPQTIKNLQYMVKDLVSQGATSARAFDVVGQYAREQGLLSSNKDYSDALPGDTLKKLLQRYRSS